jgi:hypothetical protein
MANGSSFGDLDLHAGKAFKFKRRYTAALFAEVFDLLKSNNFATYEATFYPRVSKLRRQRTRSGPHSSASVSITRSIITHGAPLACLLRIRRKGRGERYESSQISSVRIVWHGRSGVVPEHQFCCDATSCYSPSRSTSPAPTGLPDAEVRVGAARTILSCGRTD